MIDGGGELLRSEKALRLDGARLAVLALGHIEDDRMGMELRRNIAIHRASGVMLEFGGDEFAGGLRWMVPADARLRVVLELFEGDADALAVRLAHPVIAADQSRQRNRFWRGKGRVPSGAMLHRLDGLAVGVLVFVGRSLANKLFACLRVLALAELRKILGRNRTGKAELCGETALPLARDHAALRPVILLLGREFLLVIGLRLAGGQRL